MRPGGGIVILLAGVFLANCDDTGDDEGEGGAAQEDPGESGSEFGGGGDIFCFQRTCGRDGYEHREAERATNLLDGVHQTAGEAGVKASITRRRG